MSLRAATLAALLATAAASCLADEPLDAARAYYAWALSHPGRSLPSAAERRQMRAFLAPELLQQLESASQVERRCVKAAGKDEKPLIVEGDVLVGNYEGASEVAYGKVQPAGGDSASVDLDLMYIDHRFAKSHPHRTIAWQDRLDLVRFPQGWRVKEAHFPRGRTLGGQLRDYVAEGGRSCTPR